MGRLPPESVIVRRQPIFRALPDATCDLNNARTAEATCKNAIAQARILIDEIVNGRSDNALTPAEVNYRTTVKRTIARDETTLQAIPSRAQPNSTISACTEQTEFDPSISERERKICHDALQTHHCGAIDSQPNVGRPER